MNMKKIAASLVAGLAIATAMPAQAAAPAAPSVTTEASSAARDLLDAMSYRVNAKQSMMQMAAAIPNMMRQQAERALAADAKLTDAQRKEKMAQVNEQLPKISGAIKGVLDDPSLLVEMESEMVPIFARNFTPDEMKQLAAFYRTPTGKKSLSVMSRLGPEMMAVSQRLTKPRIEKAIQQFQKK